MRFRTLRTTWSVFLILACALLIVLRKQSIHTADRLYGHLWGRESILLAWQEGKFAAIAFRWPDSPLAWQWETRNYPVDDDRSFPIGSMHRYPTHLGFGWVARPMYIEQLSDQTNVNDERKLRKTSATVECAGPMLPISFLALLSGALATAPWLSWRFSVQALLMTTTLIAGLLQSVLQSR